MVKKSTEKQHFCPTCGRPIEHAHFPEDIAENLVRKFGASKLYLTFAVFVSLSIVLNLIVFIFSTSEFVADVHYAIYYYDSAFGAVIKLVLLGCAQFVTWIYALSVWMHHSACKKPDRTPTAGLNIMKVLKIIEAVCFGVFVLILLFTILISLFGATYESEFATYLVNLIVFCVLAIPITILVELYYFKLVSALSRATTMIKKGTLLKMPVYVIVWNFIMIAFVLAIPSLLLVRVFLLNRTLAETSIISLAAILPGLLAILFKTILMLRFNAAVKKITAEEEEIPAAPAVSPSEAAAAILVQDADEIIEAQVENEKTIEDMPQA